MPMLRGRCLPSRYGALRASYWTAMLLARGVGWCARVPSADDWIVGRALLIDAAFDAGYSALAVRECVD